jgi:hypothetical protein
VVLGTATVLSKERKNPAQQWKLEKVENGIYKIMNRENTEMVMASDGTALQLAAYSGSDNQQWKIEETFNGLLKITNKQYTDLLLSVEGEIADGAKVGMIKKSVKTPFGWALLEVCEAKQTAFKPLTIPGTIEVEDFDNGCPGDAWNDVDEQNAGGKYRNNVGIDIETCATGGYNIGWSKSGEWMAYTVNVKKTGSYKVYVYVATVSEQGKLHLEFDGDDKTGPIAIPNTGGYQNWKPVSKTVLLTEGKHLLKLILDEANSGLNLDKMKFEKE